MRKVLLGTTALVAASFVASAAMADEMMAEPISLSVGGHHFAALAVVNGADGADEPRANSHSTSILQDMQLVFSGSTTLDNGMTVSVTAKVDSSGGESGATAFDERYVTIGGTFGSLQLGSVESARQQVHKWAPSATGTMGLNSPYFTAAPGYLGRYNDGVGYEDAARIVYFTPTMNGFSLGVSYAPDDAGRGQYGGNSSDDLDEYKNHIGVGASFSQEFAGGSVSVSAAYESYDAEVPNGMSCASLTPVTFNTDMYTLRQKYDRILKAVDMAADNGDPANGTLDGAFDTEGSETAAFIAKAQELWTGPVYENPLLVYGEPDADTEIRTANAVRPDAEITAQKGAPYSFRDGTTAGGDKLRENCEPETVDFGLSMSFGDISVGGGWRETDTSDTTKGSVMDLGIGYSMGAMNVAVMYGMVSNEAPDGDMEMTRYGVAGSYNLGPGVAIDAQLDFGEIDAAGPKDPTKDADWVQFMIGTAISF